MAVVKEHPAVTKLLHMGWERLPDELNDSKPWLANGRWKVVVGPRWVTFYELLKLSKIGRMMTVPSDDLEQVASCGEMPG